MNPNIEEESQGNLLQNIETLKQQTEQLWAAKDKIGQQSYEEAAIIQEVISYLDAGLIRVCELHDHEWYVNEWVKQAILLSFKVSSNFIIRSGQEFGFEANPSYWYDKIPSKFFNYNSSVFESMGIRAVPGSFVRRGAFIGKSCVLMPCFVNVGAFVDEGTMIDTWSTIGSCAQIGKNCHISGGVGIGGVLEPIQANPVIIEDNCFIGARSEIAEGVIVGENSVIGMGVFLSGSTKILDRETGEVYQGVVPAGSVVVSGSMPSKGCNLYCAVIVKKVDAKTRAKTSINELLRS